MNREMDIQVVVITGCSMGIGKETALFLARDSQRRFRVYATLRNVATRQTELKSEAGSTLDDTLFIRELDVTKQETIDETVKEIVNKEGKIDVLVNNAAVPCGIFWETGSMDTFYNTLNTNFFGCVRMTRAVVPNMKERRSGRILQMSSVLGFHAVPVAAQYISAKFALRGFSESIAPPLRKFNVWVSVIEPGYVTTDMVKQYGPNPTSLWTSIASVIPNEEDRNIATEMVSFDPEIVAGKEQQEPGTIAEFIQQVILSPEPDFRYQTSETIKRLAREQCVDPTGNSVIEAWLK